MINAVAMIADELCNRERSRDAWGRAHRIIGDVLACAKGRMPDGVSMEIGVAYGDMSAVIIQRLGRHHIGVDPYRHDPAYRDQMNAPQEVQDIRKELALARIAEVSHDFTLCSDCDVAHSLLAGLPIAFAFIDGDHSQAAVAKDIAWVWDRLAPGGWIMGHDYMDPGWPGVTAAVRGFFDPLGIPVARFPGCIWGTQRPARVTP